MGDPSMSELERRFTPVPVELRASGDRAKIGGYALKFNMYSRNLGGFVERVAPSFVSKSRGDGWPDVMARYNHDNNMLLGTTDSGTLSLRVDDIGVDYEVEPPHARQDVVELVTRGDVRRSSFGWDTRTTEDDWTLSEFGNPLRTLLSGRLVDVAPCNSAIAAYTDATAGLRSLAVKMEAPFEEVRTLAEKDDLKRFFVRTDNVGPKPKVKLFGPVAAAQLLNRRMDPYA
jgi:HK97 family phage prohead protease